MRILLSIPRRFARTVWGVWAATMRKPSLREECWGVGFPDKHFLVIRRADTVGGLFSFFATNLGWIKYAEDHGFIPVVDMGHYRNLYLSWFEFMFTRTNPWEFFFMQPGGYSMLDIRDAQRVTIAEGVPPDEIGYPDPRTSFDVMNSGKLQGWVDTARHSIVIADEVILSYRNDRFEQAVQNGIIGVLARGTDYTMCCPHGHPVQPTARQLIDMVNKYSAEGHFDEKIYLVTEDRRIADEFRREYGDRLILARQSFVDYQGGLLCENKLIKHNKEHGLAYLKAIVDLSRCSSIFAGRTNGALGAFLLSKGFQKTYFFDLGVYP